MTITNLICYTPNIRGDDYLLNNKKAARLFEQISAAYNDPEVAKDAELRDKLLACAQELDKTENYLSMATKVNGVALHAARQHLKQPLKAINTLYQQTALISNYYWGTAAVTITSGLN